MNIVFEPSKLAFNSYVKIFTDILEGEGYKVYGLSQALSDFKIFKSVRIVYLNWYESGFSRKNICKRIFIVLLLKISGKKIIWTMHNKLPHDARFLTLTKLLLWIIIFSADKIIIHSSISSDYLYKHYKFAFKKAYFIPHPNYIDLYETTTASVPDINASVNKRLNLLFIGAVRPYKNIELLIDTIKLFDTKDVFLTIAGGVIDDGTYKRYLNSYAKDCPNIKLDLNFVPDKELKSYINSCDLIVLPYDIISSLNSGTAILAFSYAKTIICPEIGTLIDVKGKDDVLSYSYISKEDHAEQLNKKIAMAIDMKRNNPDVFIVMGNNMFEEVKNYNSPEIVRNKLSVLIKSL